MGSKKWEFIGNKGEFILKNADCNNSLYFPIANEVGMMSAITPTMKGDAKTGHNTFALEPISIEDLNNKKSSRNFWVIIDDKDVWSATGVSAKQEAERFNDSKESVELEAGLLWQKVVRENSDLGIKSEITNFVPVTDDTVELMKVEITNTGDLAKKISSRFASIIFQ